MAVNVITTGSSDYQAAKLLLESYELATSDITDATVKLWVVKDADQLAGVDGVERSMDIGLLKNLQPSNVRFRNFIIRNHLH